MRPLIPQNELYEQLADLGWRLKDIKFKNGVYEASGQGPAGDKITRTGSTPEIALFALLNHASNLNEIRHFAISKNSSWSTNWDHLVPEIAKAYAKLPDFDEDAVPAWRALADESRIQANEIRRQIDIDIINDPEPYMSADELCDDVQKRQNLSVSRSNTDHPVWSEDDVINFRIVHDVIGYCQAGGDFSLDGEQKACNAHFPVVSDLAREALFVECLAQAAYRQNHKGLAPTKVGLMSEFLKSAQEKEGEAVSITHQPIPHAKKSTAEEQDPNYAWQSGIQTHPVNPDDPADKDRDYINIMGAYEHARGLETAWWTESEGEQKMAIFNAFKVSILSPRKHLKWNAAHYQALLNVRPGTSATEMWEILDHARNDWNTQLGHKRDSHVAYAKQKAKLAHNLLQKHPTMKKGTALRKARDTIFKYRTEAEQFVVEADQKAQEMGKKPLDTLDVNLKAERIVTHWLLGTVPERGRKKKEDMSPVELLNDSRGFPKRPSRAVLIERGEKEKDYNPEHSDYSIPTPMPEPLFPVSKISAENTMQMFDNESDYAELKGDAKPTAKYGAWMGQHLIRIAEIGNHIDEIHRLAIKDIEEDGGRGFIFRNGVHRQFGMGLKVISFAWYLLRPMSSELSIVDTHILRSMRRSDKDINDKTYYGFERAQKALKDSSGYSHVPNGIFHHGMWDMVRSTGGQHSNHAILSVLDPDPWHEAQFHNTDKANPDEEYTGPQAFEYHRSVMEPHLPPVRGEVEQKAAKNSMVVVSESLKSKERKLDKNLKRRKITRKDDANKFGFYASFNIGMTKKQFTKYLDKQDDEYEKKGKMTDWKKFKERASKSFQKGVGGGLYTIVG